MKKIKIGLALSGGIDSSVSGFLLKKNNFYIEAFFIKNWKFFLKEECVNKMDYFDAKYVSELLNIKLNVLDFSNEYWNFVFLSFLKELSLGKTPNPDILCNKKIKFNIFLFYLFKNFNLDFLATGHYSCLKKIKNYIHINESFDFKKDQTYFLNQINEKINKKIIFPLSNYSKKDVRKIAFNNNLINFNKKDSMGICFVGNNKFSIFINKYLSFSKGNIFYEDKKLIGAHNGLFFYTIGQKINLFIKEFNILYKLYVYKKDFKNNCLFVAKYNCKHLFINKCVVTNFNFFIKKSDIFICNAKFRHGGNYVKCIIKKLKNSCFKIFFKNKQKAISAGQYISFYKSGICIGGALIKKIF